MTLRHGKLGQQHHGNLCEFDLTIYRLYDDLAAAQPSLHVDTCLHLLYLVTPYDIAARPVYTAANFHSISLDLQEPELAVARVAVVPR